MIDEGDMFNTRLWDVSMLRLNQLGYFDPIKTEGPRDRHGGHAQHPRRIWSI